MSLRYSKLETIARLAQLMADDAEEPTLHDVAVQALGVPEAEWPDFRRAAAEALTGTNPEYHRAYEANAEALVRDQLERESRERALSPAERKRAELVADIDEIHEGAVDSGRWGDAIRALQLKAKVEGLLDGNPGARVDVTVNNANAAIVRLEGDDNL